MPDNLEKAQNSSISSSKKEAEITQKSFTTNECKTWIENLKIELCKSPEQRNAAVIGNCLYVLAVYLKNNDLIHAIYQKWRANLNHPSGDIDRTVEEFKETIEDVLQLSEDNSVSNLWYLPDSTGTCRLSFDMSDGALRIFNQDQIPDKTKLEAIGIINKAK
jgi:hypothetical protein